MPPSPPSVIVWLRPEQATLVRRACAAAGVEIASAGGPGRLGPAAAAALEAAHIEDLRATLAATDTTADAVLLAETDDLGRAADGAGADAVVRAHARGVRLLSLEPVPAAAMDLAGNAWRTPANGLAPMQLVHFAPGVQRARTLGQTGELLEDFGQVRGASLTLLGPAEGGSLLARVFDAFDLLGGVFSEPETIDAVHTPAGAGAPVYAAAGSTLEGLDGAVRALVRTQDGRPVLVHAGVTHGPSERTFEVDGPSGTLRIRDGDIRWCHPDGSVAYEASGPAPSGLDDREACALGEALRHALDAPSLPPTDVASALIATQAVVLSVRTGQPESPSTVRRMIGVD